MSSTPSTPELPAVAGRAAALGPQFRHATFRKPDGVRLHYVAGGSGPVLLLVHGFPQNWWEWHAVMPQLARHFTVVAPDLKGVGYSDRPLAGYSKRELAQDLHALVASLGLGEAFVVGHDIGGMVAYAYGAFCGARAVAVLDVPVPGLGDWDAIAADPRLWHFALHRKRDLAEALVVGGREYAYISTFINDRALVPAAIGEDDMQEYVRAYSHPGAFRAAMEMYRAFDQDVADNRAARAIPAAVPVLGLGGDARWGPIIVRHLQAGAERVEGGSIADCGHFLAEEQPEALVRALLDFAARHGLAPSLLG
ncbi:MAG: alpha/beta hydrolase [Pseudomonadota bacterium]